MTEQRVNDEDGNDFSRRTFMKASGAVAGAGLLGTGAANSAIAGSGALAPDDLLKYMNPRVQEAMQAWERGYRGRADRSVGLTDSGADARHPAIGPWNGVQFETTSDGFEYTTFTGERAEQELPDFDDAETVAETSWEDANVGAGAVGLINTHGTEDDEDEPLELDDDVDVGVSRLVATLSWDPGNPEGEEPMEAELSVLEDGSEIATTGGGLEVNEESEKTVIVDDVDANAAYAAEVTVWRGVASYEVTYEVEEAQSTTTREEFVSGDEIDADDVTAMMPGADDLPELVGWNVADTSWVDTEQPRDENSHGTHVSGIMTDSGRASAVDLDRTTVDDSQTILLPGQTRSYTVEAESGTGVFGSTYGTGVEIVIEGPDGRQLARSGGASGTSEQRLANNMAQTPTVHDSGSAEYEVIVRGIEGEALPGQIEGAAAGAFLHHEETAGDVVDSDEMADGLGGNLSFHSGSAPGSSLVATVGLGGALEAIAGNSDDDLELAEEYAETFGVRAVNMSWGFIGGAPLGTVAGIGDDGTLPALRNLANAGVLPVGSAGNDATPAGGNAPPNAANETISTVATDDLDGIASYSDGGLAAVDDETGEPYTKPDVTAPGGELTGLDIAAMPGNDVDSGDDEFGDEFGDVRIYAGKGGTSMAAPSVTGLAALVAEAMEENFERANGGEDIAESLQMAPPADCGREDALRLKSVLLSTASETALTAAPYHASTAKAPVYTHGERDPYEGYGRVNFGAAVDAVTRDLLSGAAQLGDNESTENAVSEFVGLDVPRDPRAVAGFVTVRGGTLDVDLEFSHYGGANDGMARADPHLDLFVYDLDDVDDLAGDPVVVESDRGETGSASVSVDIDPAEPGSEEPRERTFMVVAKMVNVPGVVNGFDVQAHFDLDLSFEAGEIGEVVREFVADGEREIDDSTSLGSEVKRVQVTLEDVENAQVVSVSDAYPEEWEYLDRFSDGEEAEDGIIEFGQVEADDPSHTFTYFVEAPDSVTSTNLYEFGPATAEVVESDVEESLGNTEDEFGGTDDVVHAGTDVDTDSDPGDLINETSDGDDLDDVTDADAEDVVDIGL